MIAGQDGQREIAARVLLPLTHVSLAGQAIAVAGEGRNRQRRCRW
jgi:hypothetical protein